MSFRKTNYFIFLLISVFLFVSTVFISPKTISAIGLCEEIGDPSIVVNIDGYGSFGSNDSITVDPGTELDIHVLTYAEPSSVNTLYYPYSSHWYPGPNGNLGPGRYYTSDPINSSSYINVWLEQHCAGDPPDPAELTININVTEYSYAQSSYYSYSQNSYYSYSQSAYYSYSQNSYYSYSQSAYYSYSQSSYYSYSQSYYYSQSSYVYSYAQSYYYSQSSYVYSYAQSYYYSQSSYVYSYSQAAYYSYSQAAYYAYSQSAYYSYSQAAYYAYSQAAYYAYSQSSYGYSYSQAAYYSYSQAAYYAYSQSSYAGPTPGVCATPPHGLGYPSAASIPLPLCTQGTASPSSLSDPGPWNWQCLGLNGGATASCSASFSSGGVSLNANPMIIAFGDSSDLTWSAPGATTCTGTNFSTGGLTAGTVPVTPAVTTTYTVTCNTGTDEVTVTVKYQPIFIEE